MKQILMGNEAIALGLIHADIDVITGYPGTPSSEIITNYQKLRDKFKLDAYAQWATNEKVGYEVAYANAMCGRNSCATMKQVGLNVASDAFMNSAYIGNIGAMILISADDPGFYSSQTEQDSRVFAKYAKVPVLDPSTPQEAYEFIAICADISRQFQTPIMFRSTMRVAHAREICEVKDNFEFNPLKSNFKKDPARWAAVPPAGRFKQGLELLEKIENIQKFNYESFIKPSLDELADKNSGAKVLCVTSGVAYTYVKEAIDEQGINADILKIAMPYPLPKQELEAAFARYEKVIFFEEPSHCMEEQLSSPNIYGKLTNHLHKIDEFSKDLVIKAFINCDVFDGKNPYQAKKFDLFELAKRPPQLCPGCPHRDIYFAMKKVFRERDSIYTSDIGCYTLGLNQNAIDSFLCMGAAVSLGSGFHIANPDKTVISTIGDSTFLHSGVAPLINAVYQNHKFILLIMDNSTTAMTGRQTTPERANPTNIDIKRIVEGCGVECFEYFYEPNLEKTTDFMKMLKDTLKNANSPVVAVLREFCVLDKSRSDEFIKHSKISVDESLCTECNTCISKFKCPPMHYNERHKIQIDPFLCVGCEACLVGLCPTDAFIQVKG